jgi:hypothetical protein
MATYLKFMLPYAASLNTGIVSAPVLNAEPDKVYLYDKYVDVNPESINYNKPLWDSYTASGLFSPVELANINDIPDNPYTPGVIPDRWLYTTSLQSLSSGQTIDLDIVIPTIRLYGVSVTVTGLQALQNVSVMLFGDAAKTVRQYSANFLVELASDTSQAWMYRNLDGAKVLHCRIVNTGITSTAVSVSFVAEPF